MSNNAYTLADVKTKYGEKVVETATSFVINAYGKYQPNISFVLDKYFAGDPLKYRSDAPTREMIAGLGLGFGTSESGVSVLFGDFWLSKAGKPHFRPKPVQAALHVIVRANWGGIGHPRTRGAWSAPEGAAYFRRASSNGGGTGYDYYVLPVGYYLVVRDEELDGDAVITPDFTARAKVVRASFAAFDKAAADKAAAEARAEAEAEEASRQARAGLLPRLLALQPRLAALLAASPNVANYQPLDLRETAFSEGWYWSPLLYTDGNVSRMERNVSFWEEKLENRQRRPLFEALLPRAEALGLSLTFGEDSAAWGQGVYFGGYPYTQEGLASFKADLTHKEEEKVRKEQERLAAAAKARAEADAADIGLPQNVRIWHRMGGVTNRGCGWVIAPDGTYREPDSVDTSMHGSNTKRYHQSYEGDHVWNQILPGELVLRYRQGDRYDIAHCEVVYRPDQVTQAQLLAAKQIEEEMKASENAFGLDDRLGELLDRRAAAIKEAMTELPEMLQLGEWSLALLASDNGIRIPMDARSWINHAESFPVTCEGREAQVVYGLPAADGALQVVGYYKWGCWNLNLWWREDLEITPSPLENDAPEEAGASLEDLAARFNSARN